MSAVFLRTLTAALVLLWLCCRPAAADEAPRRWVYVSLNFQVEDNVRVAGDLFARAAKAGFNGIVLADYKLNILDRVPDHYFRHMEQVQRRAGELDLELIPCVAPFGYSEGLLSHDPNLAEGLPVRDAPLVVQGGVARLASELRDPLPGGSFEEHDGDAFAGWSYQDFPGKASFADTQIRHGGQASLRFENVGNADPEHGHGRVIRPVTLAPWRQYHASAWIRTKAFEAAGDVRMFAIGRDGRVLSHSNLGVQPDQDWTEHHILFNSLGNDEVNVYAGVWGGRGGKMWIDDVQLEETAFVNLLRRDGCPLVIAGANGESYVEGKDYAALVDPKMGNNLWSGSFDVYHEPPQLAIPADSRIEEGQRLTAAHYHAVTIHDGQVVCCLSAPKVFELVEEQVRHVNELLAPKTWFLSHDEIRVANWCADCNRAGRSAGQLLAENAARCVKIVKRASPNATVCVWSDMFDPHHNAQQDYYLVNGDLSDSWKGLSKDVVLINWNSGAAGNSLPFFGRRGHAQVLAGYYDGDPKSIADWLAQAKSLSSPPGVMYTTWQGQYGDLEAFARAARGAR